LARCGVACIAFLAAGQLQSQALVVFARAQRAPVAE
jgi:hypothetical protein